MRPEVIPVASVRDVPLRVFEREMLASVFAFGQERREILCLHIGDLRTPSAIPVRIHSGCVTGEVFGSERCDCAWQLRHAVEVIDEARCGVVAYAPSQDGRGAGLVTLLRSFPLTNAGMSTAEAFEKLGAVVDRRDYSHALAALKLLGIGYASLITNNPDKLAAVESAGIRLGPRIPSVMPTSDSRVRKYLRSKRDELGHLMEDGG